MSIICKSCETKFESRDAEHKSVEIAGLTTVSFPVCPGCGIVVEFTGEAYETPIGFSISFLSGYCPNQKGMELLAAGFHTHNLRVNLQTGRVEGTVVAEKFGHIAGFIDSIPELRAADITVEQTAGTR